MRSDTHDRHELSFLNTSIGLEMIVVSASIALSPAVIVDLPRSRFAVSRTNIHQKRFTMKRRDFIKDSAAASTLGFNIRQRLLLTRRDANIASRSWRLRKFGG
jgi:hypothetical protein